MSHMNRESLEDWLFVEVQRLKNKLHQLLMQGRASDYENRLVQLEEQMKRLTTDIIPAINKELKGHEDYIDEWKKAGFTIEELQSQTETFNRNAIIQGLLEEINNSNIPLGIGFSEIVLIEDDLDKMISASTDKFPSRNLSSGILKINSILEGNGRYGYDYTSKRIHVKITEDEQLEGKLTISFLDFSREISFKIDNNKIIWKGKEQEIRRRSLTLRYHRLKDQIIIEAFTITVNLDTSMIKERYEEKARLEVTEFLLVIRDLTFGMVHIMTIIKDWDGADLSLLDFYLKRISVDEIYDLFNIYVNESLRDKPKTLASSYAQSAIASISAMNNVLTRTILKQTVTYTMSTKEVNFTVRTDADNIKVNAAKSDMTVEFQQKNHYLRNTLLKANKISGGVGFANLKFSIPSVVYEANEGDYRVDFKDIDGLSTSSISITINRQGDGINDQILGEIQWIPKLAEDVDITTMAKGIWIGPSIDKLRAANLHIDGSGILSKLGVTDLYECRYEANELSCDLNDDDKIIILGSYKEITTEGSFRIRVSAEKILNVGSSPSVPATIKYAINGVETKDEIEMERRYVSAGSGQRLVYEATFGKAAQKGIIVLGYISQITHDGGTEDWACTYEYTLVRDGAFIPKEMLYDLAEMGGSRLVAITNNVKPPERLVWGTDGKNVVQGTAFVGKTFPNMKYKPEGYDGTIVGINIYSYTGYKGNVLLLHARQDATIINVYPERDIKLKNTPTALRHSGNMNADYTWNEPASEGVVVKIPNTLVTQGFTYSFNVGSTGAWVYGGGIKMQITSFSTQQIDELALPVGLTSDQTLDEDTIKLIENVEMLKEYSRTLQRLITNAEARISHIENVIDNIITVITSINDRLNSFIKQMTEPRKPSPWGIAGEILGFLSTSVGMFFPIIGTVIGITGQVVTGIGSITEGDVAAGTMELATAGLASGLGVYKFGKRMRRKLGQTKIVEPIEKPSIGTNKIGTAMKGILVTNIGEDLPPSYQEATLGRRTKRSRPQLDFGIQSTTIEPVEGDPRIKYRLNSTTITPYQSHNNIEWNKITNGKKTDGAIVDYSVIEECDQLGRVLSRNIDGTPRILLHQSEAIEVTNLTDNLMMLLFGKSWHEGALNDILIRKYENLKYAPQHSVNYPMEPDIIRILMLAGTRTNVTTSDAIFTRSVYFNTQPSVSSAWTYETYSGSNLFTNEQQTMTPTLYTLWNIFATKEKDSSDARRYIDSTANLLINTDISKMLTDL